MVAKQPTTGAGLVEWHPQRDAIRTPFYQHTSTTCCLWYARSHQLLMCSHLLDGATAAPDS